MTTSSYLAMLRRGQALGDNPGLPEVRMALLADHAPQQYAEVLKAAVLDQGFYPALFLADYDTAAFQVFDPESELYQSDPGAVIYSIAMQKYRQRFYAAADAKEREQLPGQVLSQVMSIVDALAGKKIAVIVSNLALPLERMFGNFGALTAQSLYGSVLQFNAALAEEVRTRKLCQLNDVMYLANRFGAERFLDERLWFAAKAPCANAYLPELANSAARLIGVGRGKVRKVLALDLDNTLWGGVIGDDGLDGISLGGDAYGEAFQNFQQYLLSLRDRGFVLSVCSKNNEEAAFGPFRSHPEMKIREADVSVFVANWNNKAGNLEYTARVLNLGLDSFVFLDDSPFERGLVASELPQVAVPELPEDVALYCAAVEASGVLEGMGFTAEDATRNANYRVEAQRSTEQLKFNDIDEYLASLDMVMQYGAFQAGDMPRVAQLIQRSNQFNFRTQRLGEADCEASVKGGEATLCARLSDKFGDYGLISAIVCETDDDHLFIREFVMSCRVLKRGVEEFLINALFEECARRGLRGVKGEYIASPKNAMVKNFYRDFGFQLLSEDDRGSTWHLPQAEYRARKNHIKGQVR